MTPWNESGEFHDDRLQEVQTSFRLFELVLAGLYGFLSFLFVFHCYVIVSIVKLIRKANRIDDVQHFIYILTLIIADAIVLSHVPLLVVDIVKSCWIFGSTLCRYFWMAESVNKLLSTFILTALSFDRYVVICWPKSKLAEKRNHKTAIAVIVSCTLLAFILLSPAYLNAVVMNIGTDDEPPIFKCGTQLSEETSQKFTHLLFVTGYCIPLTLMTFFYTSIVVRLYSQSQLHPGVQITRRTRMVAKRSFILVVFYFMCWTPYWSMSFYTGTQDDLAQTVVTIFYFVHSLAYVNSAMNPIFYVLLNSEFRKQHTRLNRARVERTRSLCTSLRTYGTHTTVV